MRQNGASVVSASSPRFRESLVRPTERSRGQVARRIKGTFFAMREWGDLAARNRRLLPAAEGVLCQEGVIVAHFSGRDDSVLGSEANGVLTTVHFGWTPDTGSHWQDVSIIKVVEREVAGIAIMRQMPLAQAANQRSPSYHTTSCSVPKLVFNSCRNSRSASMKSGTCSSMSGDFAATTYRVQH